MLLFCIVLSVFVLISVFIMFIYAFYFFLKFLGRGLLIFLYGFEGYLFFLTCFWFCEVGGAGFLF